MKNIVIDGVEYERKRDAAEIKRAVIIVDRGWIFAGDVERKDGRILLTRAVHVFRWESIGFDGMIANPKSPKVTLKPIANAIEIPIGSEIFSVEVPHDWGT